MALTNRQIEADRPETLTSVLTRPGELARFMETVAEQTGDPSGERMSERGETLIHKESDDARMARLTNEARVMLEGRESRARADAWARSVKGMAYGGTEPVLAKEAKRVC